MIWEKPSLHALLSLQHFRVMFINPLAYQKKCEHVITDRG
jgi:hypothetical protein